MAGYELTESRGLHTTCCVNGVTEETVARHSETDHTGHTRPYTIAQCTTFAIVVQDHDTITTLSELIDVREINWLGRCPSCFCVHCSVV